MKKDFFLLLFITLSVFLSAGSIDLSGNRTGVKLLDNSFYNSYLKYNIETLDFETISTEKGEFIRLNVASFSHTEDHGLPELPILRKVLTVPLDAEINIDIINFETQELYLHDRGIAEPVFPAQPSLSKSMSMDQVDFIYDPLAYQRNEYDDENIISVEEIGILRSLRLIVLTYHPFKYNPVSHSLLVFNNLEVNLSYTGGDFFGTNDLRLKTYSPYFEALYNHSVFNYQELQDRDLITKYPIKYVIISDPMFEDALQPFIEWKTEKGFNVIPAYTDDIGANTNAIKTYISDLYDEATPEDPAPSFILFVGDVAQIPAWNGDTGSHITDLDYVLLEGGDYAPEIYYGRFSANNLEELIPQIEKTLLYEKHEMPDPSYLEEVVMIAGMDLWHGDTWGNGQINYGTTYYFNGDHGIYSYTYLYPESGNNSANIIQNVSEGVAYINYTAHGGPTNWSDPSFTISDINGLENEDEYCLAVGNCCLTNKFEEYTCFGEAWLRAEDKGAIGYIGGTNSTYWDEDYWWGVGAGTIVANPTYEQTGMGVYDGLFHDHGEDFSQWYTSTGGMIFQGNLAVIEGNGNYNYYWEIYAIMGDPSLTAYLGVPAINTVTYPQTIFLGLTQAQITAEPYSYAGLSMNGELYASGLVDETGILDLEFLPFQTPGTARLVVTAQNHQPFFADIEIIPNEGPYVLLNSFSLSDGNNDLPEYNETISLDVILENVGIELATDVSATLMTDNIYITITDADEYVGDLDPGSTVTLENAFEIVVADNIPDQHIANFLIVFTGDDVWSSQFNITFNAPVITVGNVFISDPEGNNNGLLDPGETVTASIETNNIGHALSPEAMSTLTCDDEGISLTYESYALGQIDSGETVLAVYIITADEDIEIGTPIVLNYDVEAGEYGVSEELTLTVGLCVEDFETGDFSSFPWIFLGDAQWTIDTESYQGNYSAKSGVISHNQNSSIKLELIVLIDNQISFWKKVSSENNYDYLRFYIDNNEVGSWAGEDDWSQETFNVTAGSHTFKWEYTKDVGVSSGSDCAWIDFVVLPPNAIGATGFIAGTVTSNPPANYEDVLISTGEYSTNPDEYGNYSLELPYGEYDITVTLQGYETITEQYIEVPPFETVIMDFVLNFIAPPVNLQAELVDNVVTLIWEAPDSRTKEKILQYYKIYRNLNDGNFSMIYATTQTSYDDVLVDLGNYGYYLTAVYTNNSESDPTETVYIDYTSETEDLLPAVTTLKGNYPNPFNPSGAGRSPSTTISYSLKENTDVSIEIYNLKGQKIRTLIEENQDAGNYDVQWNGIDEKGTKTSSGIYFYKMKAGRYTSLKKMILMK